MKNKIIRCYLGADLRSGHIGLAKVALKDKIQVSELGAGSFVIFINTAQDKIKVYAANSVVAYLRLPRGKLDLRIIQDIPRVFNGSSIDYDSAMKQMLMNRLGRPIVPKTSYKPSPLKVAQTMKSAGL